MLAQVLRPLQSLQAEQNNNDLLVGLDIAEAKAVLANERYAKVVREREAFWTSNGISGVPAMIFNQKHLVTGAQGADNYTSILTQLKQMAAGA